MSTFHPASSSLANFKITISTISTTRILPLHQLFSSRQEPTFVMALLANFKNTISTISTTQILHLHQLFSSRQEPTFVMASQLKPFEESMENTKSTQRSYNRESKLSVVAHYRDNTLYATSKHFGLNTKTILRWAADQDKIRKNKKSSKHVKHQRKSVYTCYQRGHHGFGGVVNFSLRY